MARIIQFDSQMLRDGYTVTTAMVYGYLWRSTRSTQLQEEISPSVGLMQKSLNIGRASISRGINELEKGGLIAVHRGYKSKNTYFVKDLNKYPAMNNFDEDKMFRCSKMEQTVPKWNR